MLPVVRDHDGQIFFREWSGGLMSGGFELEGSPIFQGGIPERFEYQLLPENWQQFGEYSRTCIKRSPLGNGQVTGCAEYTSNTKSLS